MFSFIKTSRQKNVCAFDDFILKTIHLELCILSEKRGSNPRPRPWQGRALPTELFSHSHYLLERQYLYIIADANVIFKLNITNVFFEKNFAKP